MQTRGQTNGTQHFEVGAGAQDRVKVPGGFWDWIRALGLNPVTVGQRAGMAAGPYAGDTKVSTAQHFGLWRAVGELTGDPTLGWKAMRDWPSDQYHPSLVAALHARTYRDSVERFARYKRLCGAMDFRMATRGDETRVEVAWPLAGREPVPPLLLDAMFALVVELGRRGTKRKLNPKGLELARARDAKSALDDYFGCAVKYRAARDVLVLRTADLDLPYATHNEELLQMLAPQFERALEQGDATQGILDQVRWVLGRLLAGSRPDLAMVARELGVGERTLQRRITDEGTTFRQLLNDVRHRAACHLLSDRATEVTETAFLLGFEDANSFYRAFRSWEGRTPAEWRAANRRLSRLAKL